MIEIVDVNKLREARLSQMKSDIQRAFDNRSDGEPDLDSVVSTFPHSAASLRHVSVPDSHEYRQLLILAFKKAAEEGKISSIGITQRINDKLKHEYAHAAKLLGNDFMIRYGVGFYEDREAKIFSIDTFIEAIGPNLPELFREAALAPDNPSDSDMLYILK